MTSSLWYIPPQANTFQTVLASDGSASYCFFLYDTLQWTNTDTDNITATELLPQVATNTIKSVYYLHMHYV